MGLYLRQGSKDRTDAPVNKIQYKQSKFTIGFMQKKVFGVFPMYLSRDLIVFTKVEIIHKGKRQISLQSTIHKTAN